MMLDVVILTPKTMAIEIVKIMSIVRAELFDQGSLPTFFQGPLCGTDMATWPRSQMLSEDFTCVDVFQITETNT